jgi:hypothetical protein
MQGLNRLVGVHTAVKGMQYELLSIRWGNVPKVECGPGRARYHEQTAKTITSSPTIADE